MRGPVTVGQQRALRTMVRREDGTVGLTTPFIRARIAPRSTYWRSRVLTLALALNRRQRARVWHSRVGTCRMVCHSALR